MSIATGANDPNLEETAEPMEQTEIFLLGQDLKTELSHLMRFIDDNNIKNVVFVMADAHFPIMLMYNADVIGMEMRSISMRLSVDH